MTISTGTVGAIGPDEARAFDFRSIPDDYFDRPHRYLAGLRDWDPVHRNADGSVTVTRHEDVMRVWRDLSAVVDKSAPFAAKFGDGALLEHHTSTMLFRDPPDHDRLRAIVTPFFRPASIDRLRAALATKVDLLIAAARARGEIDFAADISYPLTRFMICRMLGLPEADGARIGELGRRISLPLNPDATPEVIASGHAAAAEFKTYLLDELRSARKRVSIDPTADVLSALVAAERDGARISEIEMQHMMILLVNGGHESTSNLLSVAMLGLVDDPERLAELRDPATPASAAIEELTRFVTPLQLQGRRLTRDVALATEMLPARTEVVVSVASANWDERVFAEPERIRFDRRPNPHLGFGAGIHICIGKPLAKLEAVVALPAFVRAFATIERTGAAPFRRTARFRGIEALPLRLA